MKTNYPRALTVNGIKRFFIGLGLAAGVILTQTAVAAGPLPVDLGAAAPFTILAGTQVTYPGAGIINGDVGLNPAAGSFMFIPPVKVIGTIYESDATGTAGSNVVPNSGAMLLLAQGALTAAYGDAAGRTPADVSNPGVAFGTGFNIGGLTLAPGVYKFEAGQTAYIVGSDLTLSGGPDDVWIFQCAVDLQVEAGVDRSVILAGGARAKNVFWQVGTAAVLGTYSTFKGTIMAGTSITMDLGGTMEGRALAAAQVTFGSSGGSLPSTNGSSQVITNFIPTNTSVFAGTARVGLSAQASSGLPVTFTVKSGPSTVIGTILGGTNLAFAATGLVSIVASQAGNASWSAAPNVTNTYNIIPPLSATPGWLAIQVTPASGSWRLTAPAGYTGRTTGTGNLAAVSAVAGAYSVAYGALSGYMVPTNNNQVQVVVAGVTSLFAGVYRPVSTDLAPPVLTATEGTYTNKVQITWPSVSGVTGYEIWKSQTNNIITAVLIVETSGLQCDDTDVVPLRSYYYWGLSKTATHVSPLGLVSMGYASLTPNTNTVADITATDMVYLPVNATNLTTAGTVSFWLGNLGPYTLNSAEVAFDFRIGSNNAAMVLLGTAQRAFTLAAGQEQLVILTAQEKLDLVVPVTLSGVKQVQVTVRHASTLYDPNLANNKTTAAGMVLVRAAGVNSPGRSVNDYDGDGKSDAALWHAESRLWALCQSGQRYSSVSEVNAADGDVPVPGDYDGDGVTDMAIYCLLNGWWNVLLSSNEQIIREYFIGGPDYTAAQCDFDGDSLTDPVVYRADGAWLGQASSRVYATYDSSLGGIGYEPVVRDYDGDGLADLAVYKRTTGLWQISLSGRSGQIEAGTFGGSDYLPVSADYDGDGLVDPAIYDPGTAYWQVLLSGSLDTEGVYTWCDGFLGSVGGIPVSADYDGDGLADPAVYHQDTSIWELFLSTQDYALSWGFLGGPEYTPITE